MISIRRSLAISFVERYALIMISLLSSIIIARLLSPEEIGIYSVSLAVIGIAQVVRDFGVGSFLIQVKDLTEAHIRTAFGLTLLIGGSLFLIFVFGAPYIGQYYEEVRLIETLRLSAINFVLLPFCSISLSLLRREMQFAHILVANILGALSGFIIAVSLAYTGFGPNSLALASIVTNIVVGFLAWFARDDRKLMLPSFSEWRAVLSFGGQSTVTGIITNIAININDLFIGKIMGFSSVALISRAKGLMYFFQRDLMAAIQGVAYPAYARAYRENQDLESQFIYSVTVLTVFAWPFYGFMAMFPLDILRLLFGTQWDASAPLVPWFCLAGAFATTFNLISPLVIAQGRIDLITKMELIIQPLRLVLMIGLIVWFQSIEAYAFGYTVVIILSTPVFYVVKSYCQSNDIAHLLFGFIVSAKVSAFSLFVPFFLMVQASYVGHERVGLLFLIGSGFACAVMWFAGLFLFKHPLSRDPVVLRFLDNISVLLRRNHQV